MAEFEFGLEVESYVRGVNFPIGGYHDGARLNRNWSAERDGSLNAPGGYTPLEFVSRKFKIEELGDMIASLKALVDPFAGGRFVDFGINESCGAHIHFSPVGNRGHLDGVIPLEYMKKARARIHWRIRNDFTDARYKRFAKHYKRDYAKTDDPMMEYPCGMRGRNIEFNGTRQAGMEWRSFNLFGVSNWDEMRRMYQHGFDTIVEVFSPLFDQERPMLRKVEEKAPKNIWRQSVKRVDLCETVSIPARLHNEIAVKVDIGAGIRGRNGALRPYEEMEG